MWRPVFYLLELVVKDGLSLAESGVYFYFSKLNGGLNFLLSVSKIFWNKIRISGPSVSKKRVTHGSSAGWEDEWLALEHLRTAGSQV